VTEHRALLRSLADGGVRFILVDGVAGTVHSAARNTLDVDVVYDRAPENVARLVAALAPYHPYLRGAPPGLPFRWDSGTIALGLNFTLTTDLGAIDLLGEVAGGGAFGDLLPRSSEVALADVRFLCVDLPTLIRLKRAAGRPKDLEAIAELEILLSNPNPRGPQ
jgi:predicted nucleotidyltransferase